MPARPRAPRPPTRTVRGGRNDVRIIGGEWRGRRLRFPGALADIRPTPDRVRETLFNWLQERVTGSRCLDLFAGSGALGFEALSRGAAAAVFVESDDEAARSLRETLRVLRCDRGVVVESDALRYLESTPQPFDIVFLDPPYASNLLERAGRALSEGGWLSGDARLYLELPAKAGPPPLPPGWTLLRSKRAGEVGYHLAGPSAADSG